ncbi:MAG: transcriptional regulator FtsR [Nocardioidaceae bacterium]
MTSAAPLRSRISIGEVLDRLRGEFPEISISKIRYLEAEGLVEPERSPAGYRKFSYADVERLRFVLTCQRERYLPLKVIKEHLDALDNGEEPPEPPDGRPPVPRLLLVADAPTDPESFRPDSSGVLLSRAELAQAADVDESVLEQLEAFGLIRRRPGSSRYDGDALVIAKTVGEMAAFGIGPRHLRPFKTAADREVGLVDQVVAPLRGQRDPAAKARSEDVVRQLAALSVRLHASLVKAGLSSRH